MASTTSHGSTTVGRYAFPNVRKLGPAFGPEAADRLQAVHASLSTAGVRRAVARLQQADQAVTELPFTALERLVAPELVLAELEETRDQRVRRLVGWRNLLALAPLLLTWIALAVATIYYQQQLARSPELVTQPFLLLWQQRFGGELAVSFSTVALLDFVLLALVLAATWRAQRAELATVKWRSHVGDQLDGALASLAVAVQRSTARQPVNAKDWAAATQKVIRDAMQQTDRLADANRKVVENAIATLQDARSQGEQFVNDLAQQTTGLLQAIQDENREFITRTGQEVTAVLGEGLDANRKLVQDQMAPIVGDFRHLLDGFRQDFGAYHNSATALQRSVEELSSAAGVLASSAKGYADIAGSIDQHLQAIETSQGTFIEQVSGAAQSMDGSARAMLDLSKVFDEGMRADLQTLARNIGTASRDLAQLDGALIEGTRSLERISGNLSGAAAALDKALARRRGLFKRAGTV